MGLSSETVNHITLAEGILFKGPDPKSGPGFEIVLGLLSEFDHVRLWLLADIPATLHLCLLSGVKRT